VKCITSKVGKVLSNLMECGWTQQISLIVMDQLTSAPNRNKW